MTSKADSLYAIVVYIPLEAAEAVKAKMFEAGAGRIGNYEACCWQVEGKGQFRPTENANPSTGSIGKLEQVAESRVEMVCNKACLEAVINAMRVSHPYEEPAYHYWLVNQPL